MLFRSVAFGLVAMNATCPQCGKPVAEGYKPFCSRRCADVDLARWLRGDYAIPVPDEAPGEDEPDPRA